MFGSMARLFAALSSLGSAPLSSSGIGWATGLGVCRTTHGVWSYSQVRPSESHWLHGNSLLHLVLSFLQDMQIGFLPLSTRTASAFGSMARLSVPSSFSRTGCATGLGVLRFCRIDLGVCTISRTPGAERPSSRRNSSARSFSSVEMGLRTGHLSMSLSWPFGHKGNFDSCRNFVYMSSGSSHPRTKVIS